MFKKAFYFVLFFACSSCYAMNLYLVPELLYDYLKDSNQDVYRGLEPRLSLGICGFTRDYFYLAAEAFVTPLKDYTLSSTINTLLLKPEWSYGGSLLPGLILDDYIKGFLRFGALRTHFESTAGVLTGYTLGLGVDFSLTMGWDVRAEYIHTKYHSNGSASSVKNDQVGLGIVYNFNVG